MGIPVGIRFPWESMGMGIAFGLITEMGMVMGITSLEWEWHVCKKLCFA